jgi:hypothetical protein
MAKGYCFGSPSSCGAAVVYICSFVGALRRGASCIRNIENTCLEILFFLRFNLSHFCVNNIVNQPIKTFNACQNNNIYLARLIGIALRNMEGL